MSVALRKIDGVTEVKVTLKEGRAKVTLQPGNTVTLAALRRAVERNGFTPKEARVTMEAEVIQDGARGLTVRVTGTSETFAVGPATAETVKVELRLCLTMGERCSQAE